MSLFDLLRQVMSLSSSWDSWSERGAGWEPGSWGQPTALANEIWELNFTNSGSPIIQKWPKLVTYYNAKHSCWQWGEQHLLQRKYMLFCHLMPTATFCEGSKFWSGFKSCLNWFKALLLPKEKRSCPTFHMHITALFSFEAAIRLIWLKTTVHF